jgi:hypothetical protein
MRYDFQPNQHSEWTPLWTLCHGPYVCWALSVTLFYTPACWRPRGGSHKELCKATSQRGVPMVCRFVLSSLSSCSIMREGKWKERAVEGVECMFVFFGLLVFLFSLHSFFTPLSTFFNLTFSHSRSMFSLIALLICYSSIITFSFLFSWHILTVSFYRKWFNIIAFKTAPIIRTMSSQPSMKLRYHKKMNQHSCRLFDVQDAQEMDASGDRHPWTWRRDCVR